MKNKIKMKKLWLFISLITTIAILAIISVFCSNSRTDDGNKIEIAREKLTSVDDYLNTKDLALSANFFAEQETFKIKQKEEKAKADAEAAKNERLLAEQMRIENEARMKQEVVQSQPPLEDAAPIDIENFTDRVEPAEPIKPPTAVDDSRHVYVGISGGQAAIDSCSGPVLFSAPVTYPYIAEHENCGGWERFGTLKVGMKVTLSGLTSGTYTVGNIINVPKGSDSSVLAPLGSPAGILQTCIPGTNTMILVGLY